MVNIMLHIVSCSQSKEKEIGLKQFNRQLVLLNSFAFIMIKANFLCFMVFSAANEIKLKK